jgi:hypothetical protein
MGGGSDTDYPHTFPARTMINFLIS